MEPILETTRLSKSFGALQAVVDVNLRVRPGDDPFGHRPERGGKDNAFQPAHGISRPEFREDLLSGEGHHRISCPQDLAARCEPLLSDHQHFPRAFRKRKHPDRAPIQDST